MLYEDIYKGSSSQIWNEPWLSLINILLNLARWTSLVDESWSSVKVCVVINTCRLRRVWTRQTNTLSHKTIKIFIKLTDDDYMSDNTIQALIALAERLNPFKSNTKTSRRPSDHQQNTANYRRKPEDLQTLARRQWD